MAQARPSSLATSMSPMRNWTARSTPSPTRWRRAGSATATASRSCCRISRSSSSPITPSCASARSSYPLNVLYKSRGDPLYPRRQRGQDASIVFEGFYPYAAEAVKAAPSVEHVVVVGQGAAPQGTTGWDALVEAGAAARSRRRSSPGRGGDLLHLGDDRPLQGRDADAPQLHRQLRAIERRSPATIRAPTTACCWSCRSSTSMP